MQLKTKNMYAAQRGMIISHPKMQVLVSADIVLRVIGHSPGDSHCCTALCWLSTSTTTLSTCIHIGYLIKIQLAAHLFGRALRSHLCNICASFCSLRRAWACGHIFPDSGSIRCKTAHKGKHCSPGFCSLKVRMSCRMVSSCSLLLPLMMLSARVS